VATKTKTTPTRQTPVASLAASSTSPRPARRGKKPGLTKEAYSQASIADNTKLAYEKDIERFVAWGGEIPTTPERIADYLSEHATTHKPTTLSRWLSAISVAHEALGLESPCKRAAVRSVLRGIRRVHGAKKRRVAPVMAAELKAMVDSCSDTLAGLRDAALLLVGFSGAMRRSELASLTVDGVKFDVRGCVVSLGRTKTDQAGENDEVALPSSTSAYCPIKALKKWLRAAGIKEGAIFRKVLKSGRIAPGALNPRSVAEIVKARALLAGLDPADYSGHSLRAGLATSSAKANKPYHKIKQQTRHRSDAMLMTYVRDAELFEDNAAEIL
jgi:integrase